MQGRLLPGYSGKKIAALVLPGLCGMASAAKKHFC